MAEQPVLPEEARPANEHHDSAGSIVPRGAIAFAIVMIIGYIIYFFLIWSEIVLLRGGS